MQSSLVVGSGFGGIASACVFVLSGLEAHVLSVKMISVVELIFEVDGYRHDAGPTVITALFVR